MAKTYSQDYNSDFYNLQGASSRPIKGILIYEEAQKKLNITDSGKLYSQKIWNYIPLIGPLLAIIYANFCIGKTKCLRRTDEQLFRGVLKYINTFAFLIWPIIFLAFWTLLSYLTLDYSNAGAAVTITNILGQQLGSAITINYGNQGSYNELWNNVLINNINGLSITSVNDFFKYVSVLFSGLIFIFVFPIIHSNIYVIGNANINTNLIFIASILLITMINPVNIFNSLIINASSLRFIIVYEASSIYRYRQRNV